MDKRLIYKSISCLVLTLSIITPAYAANSFPISVSCTIPAVPGLNVPPYQNETAKTSSGTNIQVTQEEAAPVIEKDSEKTMLASDGSALRTITKTIYAR